MLTETLSTAPGTIGPGAADRRRGRRATVLTGSLVVLAFAALAYQHRWISDDGLIVVREVRQILAGHGPNYNPFQRDEVDTSPLWTWLLAAFASVYRQDIAIDAVALGLVCSVYGLLLALAGCARLHRLRGVDAPLVPVGVLVPLAMAAFWDFATSGLETGLAMLWLGGAWWLLLAAAEGGRGLSVVAAVIIGLGPLVRPDFTLATAVFGLALLVLVRPGWSAGLGYCFAAAIVPVGYEVFRAGYYGVIVPMPALAKEASSSLWSRGFGYLDDFVDTYQLTIPLAVLCVLATLVLGRTAIDRRVAALLAAPVLSGVLMGAYVVRVGGDYMHGRMWIPAVFALLLPVLLVPIRRRGPAEMLGVTLLAVWALIAGTLARTPYQGLAFGPDGITNERSYEAAVFADPYPVTSLSRTWESSLGPDLAARTSDGTRLLVMSGGVAANGPLWEIPLSGAGPDRSAFFYNNMGIAEVVMPVDGTIVDVNGLASPLAGHLELDRRGRPGHEKWLPAAWVVAEYADPAAISAMADRPDITRDQVLAARRALSCGRLKELMDSVDQPMSWGRFWRNLIGSVDRTSLRVPADPFVAVTEFCG
jgi:arabinofuranosyltransferase